MDHLTGPRERIKRAKDHSETLDAELGGYRAATHEHSSRRDPDAGWHIFTTTYIEPAPIRLGVLVGDFAHQLGSALNDLVGSLANLNGAAWTGHHAFPVALSAEDWPGHVARMLHGLRSDHVAEIEALQPYRAGYDPADHPLAVLHELIRLDTHGIVPPVAIALAGGAPALEVSKPGVGIAEIRFEPGIRLVADKEFMRVRVEPDDPNVAVAITDRISPAVAFGERRIPPSELGRVGALVDSIIERPAFGA